MDTGSGGYFTSSTLFKTSLLTIAFSSIYIYETDKRTPILKNPVLKKDSISTVKLTPVIPRKKKTIYLTFDDGPNKGTKKVMDILNEEQMPATLFIIGEHVYGSRQQHEIYDSLIHNDLFEIANHSFTHAFENRYKTFYDEPDSVVKDFQKCADSLKLTSQIIRTPGRNIWRTASITSTDLKDATGAADSLKSKGFKAIGWDLEWHFDSNQDLVQSDTLLMQQIDTLFAHNRTKTLNSLVLLAHDRTFYSFKDSCALHRFIKELKRREVYDFETLSNYPGIDN